MSRAAALSSLVALLLLSPSPGRAVQQAEQEPSRAEPGTPVREGYDEANRVYDRALYEGLEYRMVGPSRGGRVTTVTGHPGRPHTFYMGSTGGGVWKTTDYGHTWRNVSDGYLGTASMGAVQVAGSDPDVVYAGTGSDGIRSNVVTGRGIYRSTDAGETWRFLGLREAGQIGAIEVHPRDPDLVYVAALGHPFGKNEQRGVFRSRDGGATWEKVLFVSDSVGAIDLEMNPAEPSEIYAAAWRGERKPWTIISGCAPGCGDGIYRTADGGDRWTKLEQGLPDGPLGKIDLAVSPAAPNRIYALVETTEPKEGLYRSDDRGRSWTFVNGKDGLMTRPFYFTNLAVDPTDPDVLYVGNVGFYKSTDAGETFERFSTPHPDNHDLWINPEEPRIMIQSNDGGAAVSLNGGETWTTQHNQPTAELYQVNVDDRFPYRVYAGQQDNSTISVPSRPPAESAPAGPEGWWKAVGGCETGPAVPKPGNPTIVYANCKGRFGRYSRRTGDEKEYWVGGEYIYGQNPKNLKYRFQRTVPIEVSPHDPDVVYHGSQYVHRTEDDAVHWERISPDLTARPAEHQVVSGKPITRDITGEEHFSTLYVIRVSPHRRNAIWVGSNDGVVHVTRDGGESWTDVTPEALPPDARINAIEPSPHRAGKAYVTAYRYLLDDWEPYVFRTEDHGRSWTRITDGADGVPSDVPVRVVREDPDRAGLLYAGTEFGMYVSFDDGGRWQPLQLNLPVTPVTDIRVHRKDLVLSTMGRSFWILHDLTPLHQLDREVATSQIHLFRPADAHRMRYRRPGAFWAGAPHWPDYPPPGAAIDYYLAEAPEGEVTLEILDPTGRVIRGFSSREDGYRPPEEGAMSSPRIADLGGEETLSTEAGMHRFVWDLRHGGPVVPEGVGGGPYGGPEDDGPLAVPGEYGVRLTVGGQQRTRSLTLKIDPRVREDGVTVSDLREQLDLNLKIRNAISEARLAAGRIASARRRIQSALEAGEVREDAVAAIRETLSAVEASIVTETGMSYPPPRLIDQLEYLYGMTTSADQKPGRDAVQRYEALRSELDELKERLAGALADLRRAGVTGGG